MDSHGWCKWALGAVESKVRHRRVSREALWREVNKRSRRYVYSNRLPQELKETIKECARVKGTTIENVRCVLAVHLRQTLFVIERLKGRVKP